MTIPIEGTALLFIDVINDLAFKGSQLLIDQAEPMATRLAPLKRKRHGCRPAVLNINHNFGQWRSDFRHTVSHCMSRPHRLAASCHDASDRRDATISS